MNPETLSHVIEGGIMVFVAFITLKVQNMLLKMSIDQDAKHAENKQALAVHVAEDKQIFSQQALAQARQDKVLEKQDAVLANIDRKIDDMQRNGRP